MPSPESSKTRAARRVAARGARDGLIAGTVSAAPGLLHAVTTSQSLWQPIRLVATVAGHRPGSSFAAAPVAVGAGIHIGLSAGYGAIFALTIRRPPRHPVLRGVAYGWLLHAINLGLLARARPLRTLREGTSQPVELAAHTLYGATLGARYARTRR